MLIRSIPLSSANLYSIEIFIEWGVEMLGGARGASGGGVVRYDRPNLPETPFTSPVTPPVPKVMHSPIFSSYASNSAWF